MKVTIVTPVYNGEKYIKKTIESILNQKYKNIEYIVIDGGSTDQTVEIIKSFADKLSYWISEKDQGMYDAINKGFKEAKGDIYAYLNADDLYFNENTVSKIVETFKNNDVDLVFGNVEFIDENSAFMYHYKSLNMHHSFISNFGRIPFAQQTAFWKKKVYQEIGGFDSNLKYVADTKFFFKILRNKKYKYKKLNKTLAQFRWHNEGFSTKQKEAMRLESEKMKNDLHILPNKFIKFFLEIIFKLYNFKGIIQKRLKN